MTTLIVLLLCAIAAALFAAQNPAVTSLTIAGFPFQGIPVYLIVLVSILVGLLIAAIINLANSIMASMEIQGKDSKIQESTKTLAQLTKQIHQLELENIQLKTELKKMPDEKSL